MNTRTEAPEPVSSTARALATAALKRATDRGHAGDNAIAEARKYIWHARWRAVLAGSDTQAAALLDALAQLGDQGGLTALANRAKAAVKGGTR